MKTGRVFFYLLLSLSYFHSPAQASIALDNCDSLQFKISGKKAVKKAKESNYKDCFVEELRVVKTNDSCQWHVLFKEKYGIKHHGYYSYTYHEYYIDPYSGIIIREGNYKKLGEKVRESDLD